MSRASSPLKVFLVEDVPIIRDSLILALEDVAEAEVVAAVATEDEAIAWFHQSSVIWELAVIDLLLKQGSGIGVLRAIKLRSPSQKAVVLSNYVTLDTKARCLAAGADLVFDKSTEIDGFLAYCRELKNLQQ